MAARWAGKGTHATLPGSAGSCHYLALGQWNIITPAKLIVSDSQFRAIEIKKFGQKVKVLYVSIFAQA